MGQLIMHGKAAPRGHGQRGFTFVEVMMAMLIGAIALSANLAIFNFASLDFAYSSSLTNATNLATEKIADFKTIAIGSIVSGTDTKTVAGTDFTRTWTVSNVTVINSTDMVSRTVPRVVKIRLVVSWTFRNKPHQITMNTMTTGLL